MKVSVCIFARNEERLLPECIGALDAAAAGVHYQTHILVNGSTDSTKHVARSLAAADRRITAHELPIGDKANAWNDYVFRIAGGADAHVFIDGDCRPSMGALKALAHQLTTSPQAYGAAALPITGRSRKRWAKRLMVNHYMSGNLYALSQTALNEFRRRELRLPFGATGEDGLITYLLLTEFLGGKNGVNKDRITIAGDATFEFNSLTPSLNNFSIYRRRLKRYSERRFQKKVLYSILKKDGAKAMPENILDIYTPALLARLRPRFDPLNLWFDVATLKRLRQGAQTPQAAKV